MERTEDDELRQVLESDLDDLLNLNPERLSSPVARDYRELMIAYLQGNLKALEKWVTACGALNHEVLGLVAELRLQVRSRRIDPGLFERATRAEAEATGVLAGELSFVLAAAAGVAGKNEWARDFSRRAFHRLKDCGVKTKAVCALLNSVAWESCIYPEKHFITEYQHVYREAMRAGDRSAAGTALLNISREYQKMGALTAALKSAHQAVRLNMKNAETLPHFLALVHRAHVLAQMDRVGEAKADVEAADAATFPEVHAALNVLRVDFPALFTFVPEAKATGRRRADRLAVWEERQGEQGGARPLGELEQKLLKFIGGGPRTKFELIEHLYGTAGAADALENRLANLLSRIRKRFPGLIVLEDGKYRLTEVSR